MSIVCKDFLLLHNFCSSLFAFQLSVRTDRMRGLLSKMRTDMDRGSKGLKTGKHVKTSVVNDPHVVLHIPFIASSS